MIQLSKELEEARTANKELQSQAEQVSEVATLKEQLQQSQDENASLHKQMDELRTQSQQTTEMAELREQVARLQAENEKLSAEQQSQQEVYHLCLCLKTLNTVSKLLKARS